MLQGRGLGAGRATPMNRGMRLGSVQDDLFSDDDDQNDGEAWDAGDSGGAARSASLTTFASSGVVVDLRGGELPDNVVVSGGTALGPTFEEMEDGMALSLMEAESLLFSIPDVRPWLLEKDGFLHEYSIMLSVRLDTLPPDSLALFSGGRCTDPALLRKTPKSKASKSKAASTENRAAPPHVRVSALGVVGLDRADTEAGMKNKSGTALRPAQWGWITITRRKAPHASASSALKVYVNGKISTEQSLLSSKQQQAELKSKLEEAAKAKPASKQGGSKAAAEASKEKEKLPPTPEMLILDPAGVTLLPLFIGSSAGIPVMGASNARALSPHSLAPSSS